jgi:hypothetical protein
VSDVISPIREQWIVELEPGVWLADWKGDPGRTMDAEHAKVCASEASANRALKRARKYRELPNAKLVRIQDA